jgi:hypothetical protein
VELSVLEQHGVNSAQDLPEHARLKLPEDVIRVFGTEDVLIYSPH